VEWLEPTGLTPLQISRWKDVVKPQGWLSAEGEVKRKLWERCARCILQCPGPHGSAVSHVLITAGHRGSTDLKLKPVEVEGHRAPQGR